MSLFKNFKKNKDVLYAILVYILFAVLLISCLTFFANNYNHSGMMPY